MFVYINIYHYISILLLAKQIIPFHIFYNTLTISSMQKVSYTHRGQRRMTKWPDCIGCMWPIKPNLSKQYLSFKTYNKYAICYLTKNVKQCKKSKSSVFCRKDKSWSVHTFLKIVMGILFRKRVVCDGLSKI